LANTVNIGANLGAMASSSQMILPNIPFGFWLLFFVIVILVLQVFLSYRVYARFLQILALALLAYVATAFITQPDWIDVFRHTFVPRLEWDSANLMNLVAILGTTISPYLFFWQASEEVEESIDKHRIQLTGRGLPKISRFDISDMRIDTMIGMFFSNMVMFFIIVTAGTTLHKAGITVVDTPTHAAQALLPLAGPWAYGLFTLGIIGVGMLSIPILAGAASYAVSEAIGWKVGLYNKFKQAHGFYGVIILATLIGLLVNLTSIPPFTLLYYTAILNGLCAPFLMAIIVQVAGNQKIMGKYTSSRLMTWMGWIITVVMTVAGIALIYDLLIR
jgi:Mn2+/Fe2+ NRAMP family transporter